MPFRIDNVIVLFGLFALAIPVVLHLLQRRRHDILDWGAMQFLPDSILTQRRRWLDELLLMLLRMAMIALIVCALATPISTSAWLGALNDQSTRDVVLVVDGSYSMDVRVPGQATPWDDALRWVRDHIEQASTGDRFSILVARQPPSFIREEFARELDGPIAIKPNGNPDMPRALADAWRHLQTRSKAPAKEIIVITDGQRHGWADAATLSALDNLGDQWKEERERAKNDGDAVPSFRIVQVGGELPATLPNYALTPLTSARSVVKIGQKVTFRTALRLEGFAKYQPPRKVSVLVDGVESQQIALPEGGDLKKGQVPVAFQHRFDKVGSHTITVHVDADDALSADNEQQRTIDVVKDLAVLCVDGDDKLSPESSSFFVQRALSASAIPHAALKADDLARPAVIVLADVPRLDAVQLEALDRFVTAGGGVLIGAGPRLNRAFYNDQLYRDGAGLLPSQIGDIGSSKSGVQPESRTFQHPALELFRAAGDGAMKNIRFPKWTKVQFAAKDRANVMASLSNGDPLLIEKAHGKGRVILCTVPLDRSWESNFPSAWEFPVLLHELACYLARARSAVDSVSPDLREADLTRSSVDDWRKVRERLPVVWREDAEQSSLAVDDAPRGELWWMLLAAVVALLCLEIWMTRRMAIARG